MENKKNEETFMHRTYSLSTVQGLAIGCDVFFYLPLPPSSSFHGQQELA